MNPNILLRLEQPEDYEAVEYLTREAFWNVHVPGCDEHYLVHLLRKAPVFIPELDFVALLQDAIVGNIMYATSAIISEDGTEHQVLTFGPVSVLPIYQSMGIGKALILHTIAIARELGHKAIAIYGDPLYYSKLGFVPAENYGIKSRYGFYSPALQVLELIPDALSGISGSFYEDDVYTLDQEAADMFEAKFPAKEKQLTPSQARFQDLLSQNHL